jgi:hypothetical protein
MFELTQGRAEQILEDYLREVGLFLTKPLLTKEEGVEYTKHVYGIAWRDALRCAVQKEALRRSKE